MTRIPSPTDTGSRVVLYGAYGHTGRFVLAELRRRGLQPVLAGRDEKELAALAEEFPSLEVLHASCQEPGSMERAVSRGAAVINCAGPFAETAAPAVEAALRAGVHYLDITAEQSIASMVFERFASPAFEIGVVVAPSVAFYGGLADLLATALCDGDRVDEILVAVALDGWRPTLGTRRTGQSNTAPRFVVSGGGRELLPDPPPTRLWNFAEPFGDLDVVAVPLSEIVTISSHLESPEIHSFMNLAPLRELRDPDTTPPSAADERGRSTQRFQVEVVLRRGAMERRAVARGRDIYAVTAPIIVEATARILRGEFRQPGVVALGALFDANEFLESLSPADLTYRIE